MRRVRWILVTLLLGYAPWVGAQWSELFNGKNLEGWDPVGDGIWTVMGDGTLLGQRNPRTAVNQAWLYTTRNFTEFDLSLEYWTRFGGNSGISIRDTSRARWAVGPEWDENRTPSHIGYEIQIAGTSSGRWQSGSIYRFQEAKPRVQADNDWNLIEIESRTGGIRVRLNGQMVAEHSGDPSRPKSGPIGLQLHDPQSIVMFRKIRIREIGPGN